MSWTCIVTGAGRGLGLELTRQLVDRGHEVIATVRRPEAAAPLETLGATVEQLDVASIESIGAFRDRLGGRPVDLLVNNAGMGVGGHDFAAEDWGQLARFFQVNATGPMQLAQALLPNLLAGTGRRVVNVTSKMGSIADNTSGGAYGYRASKAALNMLTKSMSIDLRADGIVAIVIHPGWVATDMGGPAAPLSSTESVAGMLKVVEGLGPEDSGRFLSYLGETIPW